MIVTEETWHANDSSSGVERSATARALPYTGPTNKGDDMRAIRCNEHGLPDTLSIETLPDLHPGAGEIVIDVKAASVNFPDVLIIQNKYQFKPPLPFTPGAEFAGIVREVAQDVTRFKPGMLVAAYTAQDAFAEQARAKRRASRCPTTSISPMPPPSRSHTARRITRWSIAVSRRPATRCWCSARQAASGSRRSRSARSSARA